MKDTTKIKLRQLLESKLGRTATAQEIGNAVTDHNLIAELTLTMAEENADKATQLDTKIDQKISEVTAKISK